jgi:hypothetical protein
VLSDARLRIVTHYPLVVVATSNTFVATPLRFPPPFPTRRMYCLPSSACVPSPCPPTDPSPTAIQHCLSAPASVVLPDARAPPAARLCLPFARHCVCVCVWVRVCVCVCVCAARVLILRVRLRGGPLPIPQARAARVCFPSCLPAPLRVAPTKQDPDTCARTRGELGGGCGGCKGEEMSHGKELGHGSWPSGWRRSLLNGVRRRRR